MQIAERSSLGVCRIILCCVSLLLMLLGGAYASAQRSSGDATTIAIQFDDQATGNIKASDFGVNGRDSPGRIWRVHRSSQAPMLFAVATANP